MQFCMQWMSNGFAFLLGSRTLVNHMSLHHKADIFLLVWLKLCEIGHFCYFTLLAEVGTSFM